MKFYYLFIILVIVNTLCAQTKKVVTIFPFHFASTNLEEKKNLAELNDFFYDLFAGQLASSDFFEVVDRQNLESMLKEVALQQSGLTEQVLRMGRIKGAELAIFGTVTRIGKQTYLTMKIIDIETSVILKAIKQKGSLKKPDQLALEAGITFMNGLSRILYRRYKIGIPAIKSGEKDQLRAFLQGRDYIQQAVIASESGDSKKAGKLKKKGLKLLEKAQQSTSLEPIVTHYKEEVLTTIMD